MTDLESPKKNNDCYFYYYSTCVKGDNCTFRHEPSALGCETMCSFWKEGKCLNIHCNFRHMELRKNRKVIPCYWESQPVGCLKAHCPFLHQNPRPSDDEASTEKSCSTSEKPVADNMLKEKLSQQSERKVTAVDSLVVNFEEESDNESTPIISPITCGNRVVKVKTLEEIKLEKIQAESAAYYSYFDQNPVFCENGDDLRQRIVCRLMSKSSSPERTVTFQQACKINIQDRIRPNKRLSSDELATILGDDSLRKKQKIVYQKRDGSLKVLLNRKNPKEVLFDDDDSAKTRKQKFPSSKLHTDVNNIKIKTLAEIRAERNEKREHINDKSNINPPVEEIEEAEVTSTSMDENSQEALDNQKLIVQNMNTARKIKLRRKLPISENIIVSSNEKFENKINNNSENSMTEEKDEIHTKGAQNNESFHKKLRLERSDSSKTIEEVLLLEVDDEEYDNVTLKAEDELLNEIDSLLDE